MSQKQSIVDFDESRYSRQILSLGKSSQIKLSNSVVEITNLKGGLGTEVGKNLVLQGVGSLILNDNSLITDLDIETGFYYQNRIGERRDIVLKEKLEKLNPYCKIYVKEDYTGEINLVIYLNKEYTEITSSDNPIIYSRVGGCRGFVFNDFKKHEILDVDGESTSKLVVEKVLNKDGNIVISTNGYHNLSDGDKVKFSNCEGERLDFLELEYRISTINPTSFKLLSLKIDNEFNFINGSVEKIKRPMLKEFNSLEDELENPSLQEDWINPEKPREQFDYWFSSGINLEDELELGPVNAYFGGLIASEAIKLITNKYMPISQWYFWEDTSYLSYDESGGNMVEKLVGKETYEKLIDGTWFMVGSGAIGCEMLKNMSLLNVSTRNGDFMVTDPDTIEVSNLSRQFLFHSENVSDSKAKVAGEKVKEFNPRFNVKAYQDKMCSDTESKYNENFYGRLDGIINALDNYQARLYMDKKAVEYGLPLFESGTQGAKGNTQAVIPHLTENYGASSDPPESESYPLCTVKNFPNRPEHVIHYMKEMFEEWFNDFPYRVSQYLSNPSYLDEITEIEKNDFISKLNNFYRYKSEWREQTDFWNKFYYCNFRDNILQILENYPKDHTIDGELFWTSGKKCPSIPDDSFRLEFIKCSLKLSSILYNKKMDYSDEELILYLNSLESITPIISKTKVAVEEKDLEEQTQVEQTELDDSLEITRLISIGYDKDIEEHYTWMYYGSLIRGVSYEIDFPDILKVRQISGKIIPAMATTTSMVAGLISLELLKFYKNLKIESYRSYFLNLALNQYLFSEPTPVRREDKGGLKISIWDKFIESNDITLGDLILKYESIFSTEISVVVSETNIVFAPFITDDDEKEKKLSELGYGNKFTLLLSNDEEEDLPVIYINLKNESIEIAE